MGSRPLAPPARPLERQDVRPCSRRHRAWGRPDPAQDDIAERASERFPALRWLLAPSACSVECNPKTEGSDGVGGWVDGAKLLKDHRLPASSPAK